VTINYAYAIDQSIRASNFILSNAYKTLSNYHKGEELTLEDIQTLHDLTVSATEEEEKARNLFNIVDRDTYKVGYYGSFQFSLKLSSDRVAAS